MNEKIDLKNRDTILRLITLSVVILELFIFACTLIYQLDDKNHIETPITEEMAKLYIDHPEKLKANERIAVSTRNSMYNNQQIYLMLSDDDCESVPLERMDSHFHRRAHRYIFSGDADHQSVFSNH